MLINSLDRLRLIVWDLMLWAPDPEKRKIYREVYEHLCSL